MDIILYHILMDVETDENGQTTQEVIDSARDIAGRKSDLQKGVDKIEEEVVDRTQN